VRRALALAASAGALLLAAPAGHAYPPRTCGMTTVKGVRVVVRTHGPTCGFATRGTRRWMARHRAPKRFRCRSYGGSEPALCRDRRKPRQRYFFAIVAQ
jgi:hypothetical protein